MTKRRTKRVRQRGGASLLCVCKKPTRVLKTRRDGASVLRRRVCDACGREMTTRETRNVKF